MRSRTTMAALLALTATAHAQTGAARGQSCGAAADCAGGLYCLQKTCVDEPTFERAQRKVRAPKTYGFIGASVGGLLPIYANGFGEGAALALQLGYVTDDGLELQLDLSPATTLLGNVGQSSAWVLGDLVASVGYLASISDIVSWPIRVGGGGGVILDSSNQLAFGEVRVDVVGVAIHPSRSVLVHLMMPSWRMMFLPNATTALGNVIMTWVFGIGVEYTF